MSRPFSMTTVLRRTPFKVLRWFLPEVGIELGFDLERMHANELPKVIAAYEAMPVEERLRVEEIVREIVVLADKEGIAALSDAAKICGVTHWDIMFKPYPYAYLHAIYAWTKHRDVFDQAVKLLRTKRMIYFRKRAGIPVGSPPITESKLDELKSALQTFFVEKQARGNICSVEILERGNGQYSIWAYPDDHPIPYLEHDQNATLIPSMVTPVFEIIFDIDSVAGTLSVSAKLSKEIKEELEVLFIRTIYNIEPPQLNSPKYDIQKLKDQNFVLATDAEDFVTAEISRLNLEWHNILSLSSFTSKKDGDIFCTINHLLIKEKRSLVDATVRQATIRFHFLQQQGRRAGVVCTEISPRNIVIRCKDSVRTEVMLKYIKKWGIEQ